jgi:hypothetical protein
MIRIAAATTVVGILFLLMTDNRCHSSLALVAVRRESLDGKVIGAALMTSFVISSRDLTAGGLPPFSRGVIDVLPIGLTPNAPMDSVVGWAGQISPSL